MNELKCPEGERRRIEELRNNNRKSLRFLHKFINLFFFFLKRDCSFHLDSLAYRPINLKLCSEKFSIKFRRHKQSLYSNKSFSNLNTFHRYFILMEKLYWLLEISSQGSRLWGMGRRRNAAYLNLTRNRIDWLSFLCYKCFRIPLVFNSLYESAKI